MVNWPVITTLVVVPAWAKLGVAEMMAGTPASTLKPPVMEAVSAAPVVTVTLREPIVAPCAMVTLWATAWVASLAVVEPTVMPAPKLATLQLGAQPAAVLKCVNRPVRFTSKGASP